MSFKRFRDCPKCDKQLNWSQATIHEDLVSINCSCGHTMAFWVQELPAWVDRSYDADVMSLQCVK